MNNKNKTLNVLSKKFNLILKLKILKNLKNLKQ